MSRPIRIQYPGAVYHVMARSNERKQIFFTDQDRQSFQSALVEMLDRFEVVLYAFCLMPNHYHLVFRTLSDNLSQAMGWLQTTFTIRYNLFHQRIGHLFQGRFKAHLVEADFYARKLVEYVHLNPIRPPDKQAPIPLARREFLDGYRWSSHLHYLGVQENPYWLNLELLRYWDEKDAVAAHEKYRNAILEYFEKPGTSIWGDLRGGFVFGREDFYCEIKERILRKSGNAETQLSNKEMIKENQIRVRKVAIGEPDRRVKMWLRVRLGKECMTTLAKEFGYRDKTGVLHAVKSLERRAAGEEVLKEKLGALQAAVSTFKR
ncbi:MAG: transposase [Deltaproteobacteria bacterium]|nr:transposase [Deltaproteobacteria bacterium]